MTDADHLMEFAIAKDPTDFRHVNSPSFLADHRVLDIDCAAGQTLITCCGDRCSFGVNFDLGALRLGRRLMKGVSFVYAAQFCNDGFHVEISSWYREADLPKPWTLLRLVYDTLYILLFHFIGSVGPCRRGRYESFQTSSGIEQALGGEEFARVTVSHQSHFVVTAEASLEQSGGR